jgi:hypothetical protein
MYICEVHGELDTEFCDKCNKIVRCDCSDTDQKRVKDLTIDTDKGERCVTIYFTICKTCGDIIDVSF